VDFSRRESATPIPPVVANAGAASAAPPAAVSAG